jgi:hypothetical protein
LKPVERLFISLKTKEDAKVWPVSFDRSPAKEPDWDTLINACFVEARQAAAKEKEQGNGNDERATRKGAVGGEQISPIGRALTLMYEHHKRTGKLLTVDELLELIPDTSRSALYADPQFTIARKAIKSQLGISIPKGFKEADGNLEARDLSGTTRRRKYTEED